MKIVLDYCDDSTYMENSESSIWLELRMREEVLDDKPEKGQLGLNFGVV